MTGRMSLGAAEEEAPGFSRDDVARWRAAEQEAARLEHELGANHPVLPELQRQRTVLGQALGAALHLRGADATADRYFRRILRRIPDDRIANQFVAARLMERGDAAAGYLRLWTMYGAEVASVEQYGPAWDGSPAPGRSVLLAEPRRLVGFGDMTMVVRYAPLVRERVGRVTLACREPLARLFATVSGVDAVVGCNDRPAGCDLWTSLFSVPRLVSPAAEVVIPRQIPYVWPDPADLERWRERIGAGPERKVGVVWATSLWPIDPDDSLRRHSMGLEHLAPLAHVPGVKLYSLQTGAPARALRAPHTFGLQLEDLGQHLGVYVDFAEVAAAVASLDLIVTVDMAIAHVAGALGRPAWLLQPHFCRWGSVFERELTTWYPTVRIFFQEEDGVWAPVVERVAAELRALPA